MRLQEVEKAIKEKIPLNIAKENLQLEREIKDKERLADLKFKQILKDSGIELL